MLLSRYLAFWKELFYCLKKIQCQPETPSLPISEQFWDSYEAVKFSLGNEKTPSKMTNIEREAFNNIEFLLKFNKSELLTESKSFLRTLREDILDYGTLPDYTLRRIASLKTANHSIEKIIAEIEKLRAELGADYLDKEKARLKNLDREIIIAIHNQNLNDLQKVG